MKKIKKLNFGCGKDIKKGKEWINVDIQKNKNIDKSFDFDKFPYPFKDNEFDYVFADNVIEHLKNPRKVILEFWRISKPNAIIEVIVPYFKAEGAYNDPTHKTFWNRRCIEQLLNPSYSYNKKNFEVLENKRFSTNKLRFVPSFIRYVLDYFMFNFYTGIKAKIKVVK